MGQVIRTRHWGKKLSEIKSRAVVVDILIPKLLGIIWKRAKYQENEQPLFFDGHDLRISGYATKINHGLVVGGDYLERGYILHVYARPASDKSAWKKVFSAQLADRVFGERAQFKHWAGRCSLLSWKRGVWEDEICAQPERPLQLGHVQTAGLIPGHIRVRK